MRTCVATMTLILLGQVSARAVSGEPCPILSGDELTTLIFGEANGLLVGEQVVSRVQAEEQFVLSAGGHPDLVQRALATDRESLVILGIRGLKEIGTPWARGLLAQQLSREGLSYRVDIAAAEALGELGAREAVPRLEALRDSSSTPYVEEFVSRALRRIESPGIDRAIIEPGGCCLRLRFLADDVGEILLTGWQGVPPATPVPAERRNQVLIALARAEFHPDSCREIAEGRLVEIVLKDGRQVRIVADRDRFVVQDESHFWHTNSGIFVSEDLARLLDRVAARVGTESGG